jgi:hypothetical protein
VSLGDAVDLFPNLILVATPAQRLLDWLQRWPKDVISVRDIQQRGPRAVRATQQNMIARSRSWSGTVGWDPAKP